MGTLAESPLPCDCPDCLEACFGLIAQQDPLLRKALIATLVAIASGQESMLALNRKLDGFFQSETVRMQRMRSVRR